MIMYNDSLNTFGTICGYIYQNTPTSSDWEWDGEFGMIRGVVEEDAEVLNSIMRKFNQRWDYCSIDDSPRQIYQRVISLFGMIPGQVVLYREEEDGLALLAVLWPWGAKRRISFRLGMLVNKKPFLDKAFIRASLKEWFHIIEEERQADWQDFKE